MRRSIAILLVATGLIAPLGAHAQPAGEPVDHTTPQARHRITIGIGLLPQIDADPSGAHVSGFVGSLAYANRIAPDWEIELGASLHDAEATFSEAASVTSFLVGANFYPAVLASSTVWPYLTGAAGPYVGSSASGVRASARTETIVGARIGAGVDVRLTRWLHGGLRTAYHATPDFSQSVGSITSARGVQLSFELGVTFGGR